jgi:hypothetical protein
MATRLGSADRSASIYLRRKVSRPAFSGNAHRIRLGRSKVIAGGRAGEERSLYRAGI